MMDKNLEILEEMEKDENQTFIDINIDEKSLDEYIEKNFKDFIIS